MKTGNEMKLSSKKLKKAENSARRGSWYGINPVTRVAVSKKAYNRSARKQQEYREQP